MIKYLFIFWFIGLLLSWIVLYVHSVLVTKYQPKQKGKYYHTELGLVFALTFIPVINWIIAIRTTYNIYNFTPPKED